MVFNRLAFHSSKVAERVQISLGVFLLLISSAIAQNVQIKPITQDSQYYLQNIVANIPLLVEIDGYSALTRATYQSEDKVTWGHEGTHAVNARIRNEFKSPNGYYLLNNEAFIISTPNIKLADVAKAVPESKRGRIYQIYLVDQLKYWENPLYVLDECVAYLNGTLVGIEYKLEKRAVYSFNNALEMYEYAKVAQELSRQSGFKEQKALDEFMEWLYINRIKYIKSEFERLGWKNAQL